MSKYSDKQRRLAEDESYGIDYSQVVVPVAKPKIKGNKYESRNRDIAHKIERLEEYGKRQCVAMCERLECNKTAISCAVLLNKGIYINEDERRHLVAVVRKSTNRMKHYNKELFSLVYKMQRIESDVKRVTLC